MQPWNDDIRRQTKEIDAEQRRSVPVVREMLDRLWSTPRITSVQRADAVLGDVHRRRFLTLGGATVLTGVFLAACGGGGSSSGEAATTSTSTPASAKDINLLRAASSLEEVAVEAYQKALDSGLLKTEAVATAAQTFQSHHRDHSQLFQNATSAAGGEPFTKPNPVLLNQLLAPRLAAVRTEHDVIQLAYDLERMAASTYQANVGTFDDIQFNQKVMTVGGIEARHVTILAPLVGKDVTPDGAFQAIQGALSATTI